MQLFQVRYVCVCIYILVDLLIELLHKLVATDLRYVKAV